jgi:hypothetical protein
MDFLFEKSEVKRILRKSAKYVLVIWIAFVSYLWFNNYMITSFLKGGFFASPSVRFAMREIAVYGIGWIGYHFVYKYLNKSLRVQYWLFLAILDMFCMLVALIRYIISDNDFLFKMYDYVMMMITSPLYFVFFVAYSLILFNTESEDELISK